MATDTLERAFRTTRQVLEGVKADQLDDPTPCASWQVRHLVGHIVGGAHWFAASMNAGESPSAEEGGPDPASFAEGDFVASFDEGAKASVEAFDAPGAQEKLVKLPFGEFPGAIFMAIATSDTFQHAWDLAKATGQSTDLDPELASQLLEGAKLMIGEQFRGPEGAAFGPIQEAPAGAPPADQLAAFLGRKV